MGWHLSGVVKGDALPADFYWPEDIEAYIPLSGEVLVDHPPNPDRKSILLYRKQAESGQQFPLVWFDANNLLRCSIDMQKWINIMKHESYRPEHRKPFTARLPVNYHAIPEKVRFRIISFIMRFRNLMSPNHSRFPVSHFNGGCEILLRIFPQKMNAVTDRPALILTHDIETRQGFKWIPKIASLEQHFGFRSLWNVVPKRYSIDRTILNALLSGGHEIGLHGIRHDSKEAFFRKQELSFELTKLIPFIREFKIKGYRSPAWYRTRHLFEVLPKFFSYDLSCLDTDLICPGGNGGVGFVRPFRFDTGLVEFPCSVPFEFPLYLGVSADRLVDYWSPKIDFIQSINGMVLITTHPDPNYLGNPAMLCAYADLMAYIADRSWSVFLPREILAICN